MSVCGNVGGNTGVGKCDPFSIVPKGVFFTPLDAKIPNDTADVMKYIEDKLMADDPAARWYPLLNVEQVDNNSADPTEATLGVGWTRRLNSGTAAYNFSIPYQKCAARGALKFNGWNGGIMLIAQDGKLAGKALDDGLGALKPKSVGVSANPLGDGQNESITEIAINFGDRSEFIKFFDSIEVEDMDITLFNGVIDVKLTKDTSTTPVANSVDLFAKVACGGENLSEMYKAELEDSANKDCWVVKTSAGAVLNVSTVSINPNGAIHIVHAAGTAATVNMAEISVLKAAGIIGYESNTLKL